MTRPSATTWHRPLPTGVALLVEALLGPAVDGNGRPSCAGRSPDFDLEVSGETLTQRTARHARAIQTCSTCPALPACRALRHDLPVFSSGIWAGEVVYPRGRT